MSTAIHEAAPANITFSTPDGGTDCPGYESENGKDSPMGLVVIQEWWGLNKNMKRLCDEYGTQGFHTLCPDLYRGTLAKDTEHAGHLLTGLDWPRAVNDIRGACAYLKAKGCKKVGTVGFCMGGALVIASSPIEEVDAGVCFYGVPDLSKLPISNIKIPLQLHFGLNDSMKGFADPDTAANLEKVLKEAGISVERFMYEGVGHAFMNRDRPEVFSEKCSEEATKRLIEFFKKHLA